MFDNASSNKKIQNKFIHYFKLSFNFYIKISNCLAALLGELKICWWYSPVKRWKSLQKGCPGYDTKLYLMVRLLFWRFSEILNTPSLSLLPGPLWPGIVVPVWISSMGQIALFQNYWYLIRLCAKNNKKEVLRNNYSKNIYTNVQWLWFLNL